MKRGPKPLPLPPELADVVGTVKVTELARLGGVSSYVARRWHAEAGYLVARQGAPRKTHEQKMRDADAKYPGLIDFYSDGMTLRAIGDRFGITREYVRQIVLMFGEHDPSRAARAPKGPRHPGYDEAEPLLGTMPDIEIAGRIGASATIVGRWRQAAGIPRVPQATRYSEGTRLEPDGDGITICRWPECSRVPKTRGLCASHRTAVSKYGRGLSYRGCTMSSDLMLPPKTGWKHLSVDYDDEEEE